VRPGKRWLARLATPVVAIPAALALTATGAQAHNTLTFHGTDYVAVGSNHRTTSVCDREDDGNWTSGEYVLVDGGARRVVDTTTDGRCSTSVMGAEIRQYRVCERLVGCTLWRYS
jgi:hypothetical protein